MDARLNYAILVSLFLHGLIIALWPRMMPPKIAEPLPIVGVSLIEDLQPMDLDKGITAGGENGPPSEMPLPSDEILNLGKMTTDRVIDGLGPRPWEQKPFSDPHAPKIQLPKQTLVPGDEEYAMIWPEEFTEPVRMDGDKYPIPHGIKGHKGIPGTGMETDLPESFLIEEFPEEKSSQQIPDITWKGTPRGWISKPEQPPTYQGNEEGLVMVRFSVNGMGEVVNAIPIQKLSVALEEKALAYIFSWRFETSPDLSLQEGIIHINFRLESAGR